MRNWTGAVVALLGAIVTIAGGAALFKYGIVADETGISGGNPALWIVLFAGILTAVLGCMRFVASMNAGSREG